MTTSAARTTAKFAAGEDLIVFVHIPKAAGTAFNDVLRRVYGTGFLEYHPRFAGFDARELTAEQAAGIRALSAHRGYGYHRMFGERVGPPHRRDGLFTGRTLRYVSILREPADRLYSYYRFVSSNPKHRLHAELSGLAVEDFFARLASLDHQACGNLQCRLIQGGREPHSATAAIARVRERYEAVVTIGDMAGLIAYLARTSGWALPDSAPPRRNVTPGVTDETDRAFVRAFTERHCAEDLALYRYVAEEVSPRFALPAAG
ncbi:MAG: sulfotransferase family 2 domain-containing protein [Hyphomicrobiaceae bacterium]|nr:sulfotransferase family 2 domain-containing protein [Hyphomicrobiaceae bacterium]